MFGESSFAGIESESGLAGFLVEAVALEAEFAEDWADVTVELQGFFCRGTGQAADAGADGMHGAGDEDHASAAIGVIYIV
jgi:hypothetical protein